MKRITLEILKEWEACNEGQNWFEDNMPEGGTLKEITTALKLDDADEDWIPWLWNMCARDLDFVEQTIVTGGRMDQVFAADCGVAVAGHAASGNLGVSLAISVGDGWAMLDKNGDFVPAKEEK